MEHSSWQHITADRRIWLGSLQNCSGFRNFVNDDVSEVVDNYKNKIASFELMIEVQYRIAEALVDISSGTWNKKIATSLSGYKNKSLFLSVMNMSEQEYCCLPSVSLTSLEYDRVLDGEITISELYRQNPTFFLGPILPKNKYLIN